MGAYFQTEPHFRMPAVTAPFQSPDQAQQAAAALAKVGFRDVQVDRVKRYPAERGELSGQPFPQSLTDQPSLDQRFFSAVDDAVSGLSADELLGESPYLLTVVLPEGDPGARERVLSIVREHGGRVGLDAGLDRSDRWDAQAPDR